MKEYKKPIIMVNSDVAEGVYANSGDCYTFKATIIQWPEEGKQTYTIKIDGNHSATDGHHSSERIVMIVFNQPVTYVSSNAVSASGSGTNTLKLTYVQTGGSYHNNAVENIGLGNLEVLSATGLEINSTSCTYCGENCYDGHSW